MKKFIVLLAMIFAIALLAQPKAQAGVFFRFGLPIPVPVPVFYGPAYYPALLLWPLRLCALPETLLAPSVLVSRTLVLQLRKCRRDLQSVLVNCAFRKYEIVRLRPNANRPLTDLKASARL